VYMPDITIFVGAWREDSPQHESLARWLDWATTGGRRIALSVLVAAGTMRVLTNRRIFAEPMAPNLVLENLQALVDSGRGVLAYPGPGHFAVFAALCRRTGAAGNLVPDAQHAAIAIEHDATWVSLDADFARFAGLRWELPVVP